MTLIKMSCAASAALFRSSCHRVCLSLPSTAGAALLSLVCAPEASKNESCTARTRSKCRG